MACCHGTANCNGSGDKHWCETWAGNRMEAIELALVCAQDIVDAWPQTTMRTIGQMTKRIETLKQALEAAKK